MIDFELTADDYVAANFLHTRWTTWRWARMGLYIAAWLFFVALVWRGTNREAGDSAFFLVFYLPLLMLVLVLLRYWLVPWQSRRIFGQTKSLQRPFHWSWNEDQLSCRTDLANVIVPWSDLAKWREDDRIFLLYPSNVMFYVFPKRAFQDAAAIDAFRGLLQRKIATPAKPETAF